LGPKLSEDEQIIRRPRRTDFHEPRYITACQTPNEKPDNQHACRDCGPVTVRKEIDQARNPAAGMLPHPLGDRGSDSLGKEVRHGNLGRLIEQSAYRSQSCVQASAMTAAFEMAKKLGFSIIS
jgi:hypothetical protein